MIFVDTNYFLRFLLKDQDEQHEEAKQLFKDGASGRAKLVSSTIVFFEVYWVLFSFYKKQKSELVSVLKNILKMKFINFSERGILEKTVGKFATCNIDLEDAYNLVYAKQIRATEFKTFDKNLLKKFTS